MSTMTRWGALFELGLRENLWGRRTIGLLALGLAPAVIAFAIERLATGVDAQADLVPVLFIVGVGLVVPLIALVVGASALRDDLRDGTIVHLATRPVHRETILATRLAGAAAATLVLSAVSLTLALAVLGSSAVDAWLLALQVTVFAALAYTSLFALLGVVTKRAVLLGVVYVFGWEGVVASTPIVFHKATLAYWIRSIIANANLTSTEPIAASLSAAPAGTGVSMAVLVGVAIAAGVLGAVWFGRRELPGPEPEA